jgi:hypothetical protein
MACNRCTSENQSEFPGEITLCFTNDPVRFTGRLLACLDCGFSEIIVPEAAVRSLRSLVRSIAGRKHLPAI